MTTEELQLIQRYRRPKNIGLSDGNLGFAGISLDLETDSLGLGKMFQAGANVFHTFSGDNRAMYRAQTSIAEQGAISKKYLAYGLAGLGGSIVIGVLAYAAFK